MMYYINFIWLEIRRESEIFESGILESNQKLDFYRTPEK